MVVTRLSGGLGNQMFEYAAGRALAERHHTTLELDLRLYKNDPLRRYALGCFKLEAAVADPQKLGFYLDDPSWIFRLKGRVRREVGGLPKLKLIKEIGFSFYENGAAPHARQSAELLSRAPANAYLAGLWQSQRYFADYQSRIREDFAFKEPAGGQNKAMLKKVAADNSVSVHVRRADYVTTESAKNILGALSLDYYQAAVEHITQKVANPTFYVFSDDPKWCKENLDLGHPTVIVDHNPPERAFEDLRLMAACRHNIIANSSFSWWGAWLNGHEDKIVIGPKRWFRDPTFDSSDMLPKGWITL